MFGGIVLGLAFAIAIGVVLSVRPRLATVAVRAVLAVIAVLSALVLLSGNAERIGFLIPVVVVLVVSGRRTAALAS